MIKIPIDVWNIDTFDDALLTKLHAKSDVVANYTLTETRNFIEYTTAAEWRPRQSNPYTGAYQELTENCVVPAMETRTVRAWHYTRLTDAEVELLRTGGIYVSTLGMIRKRLNAQIAEGLFSVENADALYAASPFHHQGDVRANKFWMTSHPLPIDDSGVTLLLQHWGGEGVHFWLKDVDLIELVQDIGTPRVIEIAVPLNTTNAAHRAAEAVVATFARALGYEPDAGTFDLYSMRGLDPETVVNIHTEGEPNFAILARGYPTSRPVAKVHTCDSPDAQLAA